MSPIRQSVSQSVGRAISAASAISTRSMLSLTLASRYNAYPLSLSKLGTGIEYTNSDHGSLSPPLSL